MPPTTARARRRTSRRWLTWLGGLLIVGGLGLLGYVGWQFFVTNWTSRRVHASTVEALQREWSAGSDRVVAEAGTAGAILRIPRFGDDFAVPILDGSSTEVLAAGVGRLPGSARPGAVGNYTLAAHRVTHGEPFRDLPSLVPGDRVVVETRKATYTYVLDTGGTDLSVPFTHTWVIDPAPVNPDPDGVGPDADERRLITLTTCAELFHTDDRLVAFGHLESVAGPQQRD